MIGILQAILCAIQKLAALIIDTLIAALNGIIVAIVAAIGFVIGLLPALPDLPPPPDDGILAWLNFFVPLAGLLGVFLLAMTLWGAWMLMATALRWLKAIE